MPSEADRKSAASNSAPGGRDGGDARPRDPRQERLARALRDNLRKRKVQQRQRQAAAGPGEGDDTAGGG